MRKTTDPDHALLEAIEWRLRTVEQAMKLVAIVVRDPEARGVEVVMKTADDLMAQVEAAGPLPSWSAPPPMPPPPPRPRRRGKRAALQ